MVLGNHWWICWYVRMFLDPGRHSRATWLPRNLRKSYGRSPFGYKRMGKGEMLHNRFRRLFSNKQTSEYYHLHVKTHFRRLFHLFQTSVLGGNSLEIIQTSESIGNKRLFLYGLKTIHIAQKQTSVSIEPDVWIWYICALCTPVCVHVLPASPWQFLCLSYVDFYGF